jgi:putative MATE family efflux protein
MRVAVPVLPLRHEHDAEILRLAVPAFGALVAEPLFLLADAAIVGHLGTAQLAGLAIASTLLATALSLCTFLAYGTTAAVARRMGAGDLAGALRQGVDGLWLAGILGTSLALLGFAGAGVLIGFFGADAETSRNALIYLRLSMIGLPAMLAVLAMTGVLRGLQDTRTPLMVAVSANIANILLNFLLVYGLELGIAGSAVGTVIAQWASVAAYLFVVVNGARKLGVKLAFSRTGSLHSFRASAPLMVRSLSLRIVIVLSAAIAARIGQPELAAHQVAFALWSMLALGLDAIAIAGQALVGRYLGAGDLRGVRVATGRMVEWSVVMGLVFGLVLVVVRQELPVLFTEDREVRELLSVVLVVMAVAQPAAGWVFALDGVLIGAGDARYLAVAQAATVMVFAPLAAAVLVLGLGLVGLWLAIDIWVIARLLFLRLRERTDDWVVVGATR